VEEAASEEAASEDAASLETSEAASEDAASLAASEVEAAVEEELPQAVMLTARTRAATVTQTFLSFISKISLLLKK
jgi:RecB family exonuclease